ncbi:DUF6452 family protein [Flavobacterium sp. I3-2]|uniref:DUF6452 family protein n=1 Tax=Flavobacterium sp. I3-2 TaxID=2748319 RepID=UPI0015B049DD|nr:DUF6452 family protein [Flavobacterium sp. I3-2]
MINLKKTYLIAFVGIASFFSCEKDDICDGQAVTPNVRIELYDKANSTVLKPFFKIECFVSPEIENDSIKVIEYFNKSEIQLPLNIASNKTIWNLKLFEIVNNDTIIKTNQLTFNYTPKTEYVSKACGYKTVFENVSTTVNNNEVDYWITNYTPLTNNITNEENPHAKIYY